MQARGKPGTRAAAMRSALLAWFCLGLATSASGKLVAPSVPLPDKAPVRVVVATEPWDRLVYADAGNVPRGAIVDFVRRMNEVQSRFRFELVLYPRLRLNQVFIDKQADVYPFRTAAWAEPELGLLPTRTIISSGDVYFALRANHFGGPAVFSAPRQRIIAAVRGYHYALFENNPEEATIRKHFKATLLNSNEAVVRFVLADRADIGIVPEMILARFLDDPATRDRLIVGDYDSRVELSNLVRKGGPISVAEMDGIIDLLAKAGDVERFRRKYGRRPASAQAGKAPSPPGS